MDFKVVQLIAIFAILVQLFTVNCFTNLFNGLKNGGNGGAAVRKIFYPNKPTCGLGSYFFNGSCYFISNYRPNKEILLDKSVFDKDSKYLFDITQISSAASITTNLLLPNQTDWESAANFCRKIHNESTLVYFDNRLEYEMLMQLLFKLKVLNNKKVEQTFFIGLKYNETRQAWSWINGLNFTDTFLVKDNQSNYDLDLRVLHRSVDEWETCGYLSIRGNRGIVIEDDNCNTHQKAYICKYVLDRCYNNSACGRYGECINDESNKAFKCRCRIWYDGKYCEKWSSQGIQMLCSVGLVVVALTVTIFAKLVHSLYRKNKNNSRINKPDRISRYILSRSLPQRLVSVEHFAANFCSKIETCIGNHSKFIIVLIASLALACFLLFIVTYGQFKLIENGLKSLNKSLSEKTNSTNTQTHTLLEIIENSYEKVLSERNSNGSMLENDIKNRLVTEPSQWSIEICKLVDDQFIEDMVYFKRISIDVLISMLLTVFLYVYSSFSCKRSHKVEQEYNPQTTVIEIPIESPDNVYDLPKNPRRTNSLNIGFDRYREENIDIGFKKSVRRVESENIGFRRSSDYDSFDEELPNIEKSKNDATTCAQVFIRDGENNKDLTRKKSSSRQCCCKCGFDYISIMNPFGKKNRLITAVIYAAYTYNILKIFEKLIIGNIDILIDKSNEEIKNGFSNPVNITQALADMRSNVQSGILVDLLKQILDVIIIGLRYYPILLCVEMKRKRLICYLLCSIYMWLLFVFYLYSNLFCTRPQDYTQTIENLVPFEKNRKFIFFDSILYENLIFYVVSSMLTIYLTVETVILIIKKLTTCINASRIHKKSKSTDTEYESNEYLYTKKLFRLKMRPKSFIKYLFEKYIYKYKVHFKYSKQFINTYVIAFILLYYITSVIIRKSSSITELIVNLWIAFIDFVFDIMKDHDSNMSTNPIFQFLREQIKSLFESLFLLINSNILIACCITTSVYAVQLLLGIRNYQNHVLNAYKGVYTEIPGPKHFSSIKKASSSLHYSGYMIGYLLWGYLFLFQVIIAVTLIVKFLLNFYFIFEKFAKIILPIMVMFLFKKIFIWYLTRYFLVKKSNKFFLFKNRKLYYIIAHFNFFFDCFLGSFVCFMRMAQASLAALFFMPRLDYSIFGRTLERIDMGFISYVNFIHMDVNQSHPVKIAFCELLLKLLKKRRLDGEYDEARKRRKIVVNRWFLGIMLSKVQGLHKHRKSYFNGSIRVRKVENFENFLERKIPIFKPRNDSTSSSDTITFKQNETNRTIDHSSVSIESVSPYENYSSNTKPNDSASKY